MSDPLKDQNIINEEQPQPQQPQNNGLQA